MADDDDDKRIAYEALLADVLPLAAEIKRLNEEAVKLGLFPDDRGLLECKRCGLTEDVLFGGKHVTYFGQGTKPDTGLRFIPTPNPITFTCPVCGTTVYDPDEMLA